MANDKREKNEPVSEKIKDGAGAAFHSVHRALEETEDAAMNAVDATAKAVDNFTEDNNR
ncbi:hypothetical protein M3182_12815 [Mesobacillus maritimus]|uniref:hypothetical protein n=1 Tax=Mesobacillus maritimus TaxID=1643336 RepID=UPI00203D3EAC|nr:hypothetical protein [Mesobacillus maritimus]MCM3586614.1 hypothetical protein [Mesobacillus maritimus]MCM3668632.1 hypothetical protein [Mesobacillus maritimus]